jgi:hypothetical protein
MMQHLLWITLFVTCVTSTFIHATRAHHAARASQLFDATSSFSSSNTANTFPNNLFSYFDIEGAGAYSILGYNGAKITYPPIFPGNGLVSSSLFAIDPANKRIVFNQGQSGNQYVFANGTYITLNVSTDPRVPLICTYLPYVNYTQEVLAINNITLQDIFYQPAPRRSGQNQGGNSQGGTVYEQVKLYSGIMVDASSCGTMIQFSVTSTQNGHIRGIYAAEPFNIPAFGSPTGVAVTSSALIFDDSTIVAGVNPAYFQLPNSCLQPIANLPNFCAATGFGYPPTPICDLFPPIPH